MSHDSEIAAQVQWLVDIEQIKQLKARYALACDDDYEPDTLAGLSSAGGNGSGDGPGYGERFDSELDCDDHGGTGGSGGAGGARSGGRYRAPALAGLAISARDPGVRKDDFSVLTKYYGFGPGVDRVALAVEVHDHPDGAVHGRVRRPHVDRDDVRVFGVTLELRLLLHRRPHPR